MAELVLEYPDLSAGQLQMKAAEEFKRVDVFVPGPDSFRKLAKQVRESKEARDAPWSIGSAQNVPLGDAIADVLAVWRMCVMDGDQFTVCQARWVARLRGVVGSGGEVDRLKHLYLWASLYAGRERACEAIGQPLHTRGLDARLAFSADVYSAIHDTKSLPDVFEGVRLLTSVGEGGLGRAALEWMRAQRDSGSKQTFQTLGKDQRQDALDICRIWSGALTTGSRWDELESDRRREVIKTLAEQAVSYYASDPLLERGYTAGGSRPIFRPSHALFAEIGYEDPAK